MPRMDLTVTTETALATVAGRRGQSGTVQVRAELVHGRTRFTHVEQRPPLGVSRALHLDAACPDMAFATLTSAAGGVLQGDVLATDVEVGPGARLHLGTQSATRFYRMPAGSACLETTLEVATGGYLELIPDAWIPYAGSRVRSVTRCRVSPDGVLIVAEVIGAGRAALGESMAFERLESITEIEVGGVACARDTLVLDPEDRLDAVGRVGSYAAVGSLFVVARGMPASLLQDAISDTPADALAGASDLPNGVGAWLRVLAQDSAAARAVIVAAWTAARLHLLGAAPPVDRRG
jgi:urease accessory protein